MSNLYIKFRSPDAITQKTSDSRGQKIVKEFLKSFIPVANPEFENKIENVFYWLIEFENENEYPNREIGLDSLERPIMMMPWRKNYGYWTDNNLLIKDFRLKFEAVDITKEEFEKQWTLLELQCKNEI